MDWNAIAVLIAAVGAISTAIWTLIQYTRRTLSDRIDKLEKDHNDLAAMVITHQEFDRIMNYTRDELKSTKALIAEIGTQLNIRLDTLLNNLMAKRESN